MALRSRLAIVLVLFVATLGGCSEDPSDRSASSVPGHDQPGVDNPTDAARKPKGGSGPGTTREEFMPILKRSYDRVSWPPSYAMTADQIWTFMAAGASDTAYAETDATNMVTIWNTCAWTLQLVADTRAGRPVERDVTSLVTVGKGDLGEVVGRIASDARLGELGTARQFISANDCAKGFKN